MSVPLVASENRDGDYVVRVPTRGWTAAVIRESPSGYWLTGIIMKRYFGGDVFPPHDTLAEALDAIAKWGGDTVSGNCSLIRLAGRSRRGVVPVKACQWILEHRLTILQIQLSGCPPHQIRKPLTLQVPPKWPTPRARGAWPCKTGPSDPVAPA